MLMQMARIAAQRGTCERKQVGAVIALEGRPLSIGYNGSPPGCAHCQGSLCPKTPDGGCLISTHAEVNAIGWAARHGIAILGADLFVTVSPCYSCAKQLITAGISQVWYDEGYRDDSGILLLRTQKIKVTQYGS